MTRSFSLGCVAVLLTLNLLASAEVYADADDLTVSFVTKVPGEKDPFVCNAGILHAPHSGRVCYWQGDTAGPTCNPAQQGCECTSLGTSHLGDFVRYTTYQDDSSRGGFVTAGDRPDEFRTVYPETSDSFVNEPLTSLTFHLGSELFGAKFFIDVCYQPLEIPALEPRGHKIDTLVHNTDTILTPRSYLALARPRLKISSLDASCTIPGFNGYLTANAVPMTFYQLPERRCRLRYMFEEEGIFSPRVWQLHADRLKIQVTLPIESCTHDDRYWASHAGGAGYEETWGKIQPSGPFSPLFDSGLTWLRTLDTQPSGSPSVPEWVPLAHQWMAAELNRLNGVDIQEIEFPLVEAGFLVAEWARLDLGPVPGSPDPQLIMPSGQVLARMVYLAGLLEQFNDGVTGPGNCEDLDD